MFKRDLDNKKAAAVNSENLSFTWLQHFIECCTDAPTVPEKSICTFIFKRYLEGVKAKMRQKLTVGQPDDVIKSTLNNKKAKNKTMKSFSQLRKARLTASVQDDMRQKTVQHTVQ